MGKADCCICNRSNTGLKSANGSLPIFDVKKPEAGINIISTSLDS